MNIKDVTIDMEVVRSEGDYVVGRIGNVIEINSGTNQVRVAWKGNNKTWVSATAIQPTSAPYEIIQPDLNIAPWNRPRGRKWPIYKAL